MPFINFFQVLVFFYFYLFNQSRADDPTYLYHFCFSNDTAFSRTSLDQLLSSLSNSTRNANGFFNTTAGAAQNSSMLYGLFLCRGDVPADLCQNCVGFAANESPGLCPRGRDFIVWYGDCMLRYSNESFFGTIQGKPRIAVGTTQEVTYVDRLNRTLPTTFEDIAKTASNAPPGEKKFATKEANLDAFLTVYALAECIPDLSKNDCYECLRMAISEFNRNLSGKTEGNSLYPSCNARYRMTPFYNQIQPPPPQLPELSAPPPTPPPAGKGSRTAVYIIASLIGFFVLLASVFYFIHRWRAKLNTGDGSDGAIESLQFDLATIRSATNNFADANVIGRGGFGSVYKGMLLDEQEIAVKRLSETSTQGVEEFKNEVVVVAKLQHRNLVKLLGFCADKKERILIYEFVPNKSLDYFLFDDVRRVQLDWPTRYKIIKGIARGLLYLHTDSHLRIIHRDLKASNILLDENMIPKISDFGMARIMGDNRSQEQTGRVVGTYGYISPEYAMNGQISVKSDVFSFGILLLEIISGKGNTSFYKPDQADNLLTYAWRHWRDGKPLELMDPSVRDSYTSNEVSRCIQIGLLCVQEAPEVRPDMTRVVIMLSSAFVALPSPQKAAFFYGTRTGLSARARPVESDESTGSSTGMAYSSN